MSDQLSKDLASLRIDRDRPPDRGGVRTLVWLLIGAAAVAAIWFFAVPWLDQRINRPEVVATQVTLVSPAQASVELTATGYVVPQRLAKVGVQVSGRIVKLYADEGATVAAGDILFELQADEARSALSAAEARAKAAEARVSAARAAMSEIRIQAQRQRKLAEAGSSAVAVAEDLEARADSLARQVDVAEAEVRVARADVLTLKTRLELSVVHAPMAGRITKRFAQAGDVVDPSGQAVLELVDFTSLVVEAEVPESRLGRVRPGAPTEIVLDAWPEKRHRGAVTEIVPRVERAKATVTVKIGFTEPPEGVLPDMAARVSFLEKPLDAQALAEPPRLVVSKAAVTSRGGADVVFVLDGDRVRQTPVQLGTALGGGDGVILQSGPREGTRVVKDPSAQLADGMRVKETRP